MDEPLIPVADLPESGVVSVETTAGAPMAMPVKSSIAILSSTRLSAF